MASLLIWRWILPIVTILLLQIRITVFRKPDRKPLEYAVAAIAIYFFSVVFQASLPVPVVCDAAVEEYMYNLTAGAVDIDTKLPEFQKKLKNAGVDRMIAEVQKQVDEWKKNK